MFLTLFVFDYNLRDHHKYLFITLNILHIINLVHGYSFFFFPCSLQKHNAGIDRSATGRIGVSLAQLSAVKDVVFSFKRAESRLVEMSGKNWGRSQ